MAPPPDDRARRTRPDEKVDATTKDAEANHARSQGQSVRESRRMSEAATRCNFLWHSLSRRPLARGGRRGLTNRLTLELRQILDKLPSDELGLYAGEGFSLKFFLGTDRAFGSLAVDVRGEGEPI